MAFGAFTFDMGARPRARIGINHGRCFDSELHVTWRRQEGGGGGKKNTHTQKKHKKGLLRWHMQPRVMVRWMWRLPRNLMAFVLLCLCWGHGQGDKPHT